MFFYCPFLYIHITLSLCLSLSLSLSYLVQMFQTGQVIGSVGGSVTGTVKTQLIAHDKEVNVTHPLISIYHVFTLLSIGSCNITMHYWPIMAAHELKKSRE